MSTKEFGGNSLRFGGKPFFPQDGGWAPKKGGHDPPFEEKRGSCQNKHSLHVGWRNFFSSCAIVSVFFFVAGNSFRCYLPTIPVVPLCLVAQVIFLVVAEKCFRCYLLTNHTSCAVVSVFWCWREIVFGCTVSMKDSYLVSLRERGSVYLSLYLLIVTIISQKYQDLSM